MVYEALRERIVTGDLSPGKPLVETALAVELGVSRTPIREALRRLEQDGLVNRMNRGLQVRERSPSEILEIFEVRIALEGTAARLAAEHHTAVDRIRMQAHLNRMDEHQDADPTTLAAINREFHETIWQASHNRTLIDVLERLAMHISRYPGTTYRAPGRAASSLSEHRELLEAIIGRDSDRAAQIASHHMTVARDLRLQLWESDPDSMAM